MILCRCEHMRSDHKAYYGSHGKGNGEASCSVPGCDCEGYVREDAKVKPKKEDTVMRCVRISKKDIQASLNRKFGKENRREATVSRRVAE